MTGDVVGGASVAGASSGASSHVSSELGHAGARARVDEIRGMVAAADDAFVRARLRIRLADLLSALGDVSGAAGELKKAAAEAPVTAGLSFSARIVAARLDAGEAEALRRAVNASRAVPTARAKPRRPPQRAGSARAAAKGTGAPRVDVARPATVRSDPSPMLPPVLLRRAAKEPEARQRQEPLDAAFAALGDNKPVRARRIAEEQARLADPSATVSRRLQELVTALDKQGTRRESLKLARTLAETHIPIGPDGASEAVIDTEGEAEGHPTATPTATTSEAVAAVVDRATRQGEAELARRWSHDVGRRLPRVGPTEVSSRDGTPTALARFRAAQKAALSTPNAGRSAAIVAQLCAVFGDRSAGVAAFALAEKLVSVAGGASALRMTDLLRLAFEGARSPRRRAHLAARLAEALATDGDFDGALAALDRAIEQSPLDVSGPLRKARVRLLKAPGWHDSLCRALASDAATATGRDRAALRLQHAALLDGLGEFDGALEVRLAALEDAPGDLGHLAPARKRLEAVGRVDRSLELATAAIPHVHDRSARAGLLRELAVLAEKAGGQMQRAAIAWLDVLTLVPHDAAAFNAAERLLRQIGDRVRLGNLLASEAGRQAVPEARAAVMWRLAEFRRLEQQEPIQALTLYRQIVESRERSPDGLPFKEEDWQRRDDELALHTARALAAPTATARAQAIADRASVLIDAGRLDEADRDLSRALELEAATAEVMRVSERLHERRGDWRAWRQRLVTRVESVTGTPAAHLWFGIGRANERLGDPSAARAAYERALAADGGFRQAVTVLRQLAVAREDFLEVARLLEHEIGLAGTPSDRIELMVELAVLLAGRLDRAPRAVEILEAALVVEPAHAAAAEAMFGAALAAGMWEKAAQVLETSLAAGAPVTDAAQRYHRVALVAETAGQADRALGLYSRSYARNPAFRPTLERLSEICFDRQQWDNAWKATEHLIDRHGADLDADTRADLALRSALSELHVSQRTVAMGHIAGLLGSAPLSQAGLRDVADSWASMRFDPRLLQGLAGDRRARVLSRLGEVLALTESKPSHRARATAREALAALSMVEQRWADAVPLLDDFGADAALDARRRGLFLVTAGDILLHEVGDAEGAAARYHLARALNPGEPRLPRSGSA